MGDRPQDSERQDFEHPQAPASEGPAVVPADTLKSRTLSVRSMNRELSADDRAALKREIDQLLKDIDADPQGRIPVGHFLMAQLKIELISAQSKLERQVQHGSLEAVQPVSGQKVDRLLDDYGRERLFDASDS